MIIRTSNPARSTEPKREQSFTYVALMVALAAFVAVFLALVLS